MMSHYIIQQAIEIGAERIGHGYRVVEDEQIYAMAKKNNIHFEVRNKSVSHIMILFLHTSRCALGPVFTLAVRSLKVMQ